MVKMPEMLWEEREKGFEEEYENNASDFMTFGRNRADLQVSAEGQDARTTRGLLAQGVGGSGLQRLYEEMRAARQQNYGQFVKADKRRKN
jgi:hypothetical protein